MIASDKHMLCAIGLMSGTSMDGIDAALIETDGYNQIVTGPSLTVPYDDQFRRKLRHVIDHKGETDHVDQVTRELTELHAIAVEQLVDIAGITSGKVDLIGFHGHTVLHDPPRRTWQIGNGSMLAARTGIAVINDFRSADVAAGGQGAPLVPLYHQALASNLEMPLAIVNIGGVANITYLSDNDPIAFDTGPGMALIDDLLMRYTGKPIDFHGQTALAGKPDNVLIQKFLKQDYFLRNVPKSLDRNAFSGYSLDDTMSLEDSAATLAALTAATIAKARDFLPDLPRRWLITGGGRHNKAVMLHLREILARPVDPVEEINWNGDALEAQAFAYLAVRARFGLPLTLPTTTGVNQPLSGGILCAA